MPNDAPRNDHLKMIRNQFPGITLAELRLGAGWDHHVYFVNDQAVFRFPRQPRLIAPHRKIATDELAATGGVPFQLPTFEIRHDAELDIWFEVGVFIPGVGFTPDIAKTFSHDELMTIARQLAAFLNTLHAQPLQRARDLGMNEMDPTDFWEFMEFHPNAYPTVRKVLWPVLSQVQRKWIEHLFESFIDRTWRTLLPLVVRHSDIFTYHIIVPPMITGWLA
jgi:hypothetical protein